jgi:hypothetical protein
MHTADTHQTENSRKGLSRSSAWRMQALGVIKKTDT